MIALTTQRFEAWFAALENRHRGELTFPELRRGLQALSTVYVERRGALPRGAALDGAGKRAAFAIFYGPLHFAVTAHVVGELGAAARGPSRLHDLGCGTGAAGAAWALGCPDRPTLAGIDLNPWAVAEARWTWRHLGLEGAARRGRLERPAPFGRGCGVLAAYSVNELPDEARSGLLERLLAVGAGGGSPVLVIEPIARRTARWWDDWAAAFRRAGGRADEWRFAARLPDGWHRLDRAAGLDHSELTARTLFLAGNGS